ncbi:Fanconi anemia group M protein [Trichinella zimbabwensis]|uniref:Fanconi anemia group M protein n=1 Tax=Trichinella zimbabwensis TaxID=268475 RepID=A0A0V1I6I8_9BILA|nr:Fanconi anemia group M protein [Trichinella zimbabwensis]
MLRQKTLFDTWKCSSDSFVGQQDLTGSTVPRKLFKPASCSQSENLVTTLCDYSTQTAFHNKPLNDDEPVNFDDIEDDLLCKALDDTELMYNACCVAGTSGFAHQSFKTDEKKRNYLNEDSSLNDPVEIDGFDKSAGRTWIYPSNVPLRQYQYEIAAKALYYNTLVTLPTGLGKTLIAAVVMYNFYRWYPSGKIVFMAPTKPLVAQQVEACYKIMGVPNEAVAEMTGCKNPASRKLEWETKRMFFLTPQVFLNDLSRLACPVTDVKCLVVDEAHRATGNHAYCQVINEMIKYGSHFRVLALSATPGSDLKMVQQVIENLLIANLEIRSEDSAELQQYTHNRAIKKIVVPFEPVLVTVAEKYINVLQAYFDRLSQERVLTLRKLENYSKWQILQERDKYRANTNANSRDRSRIESLFHGAISLYHGYELMTMHGFKSLFNYLTDKVIGDQATPRLRQQLSCNCEFVEAYQTLRQTFDSNEQILKATQSKFASIDFNYSEEDWNNRILETLQLAKTSHPKMVKLIEILLDHFQKNKEKQLSTRVIVFSSYRDSVSEITEMLNNLRPLIKAMKFVGQSYGRSTSKGISQKKQLEVVKEFQRGCYNTLVSTCVGEEGLDIGEVDLIVCYDSPTSPIRLVQRMGRTARKREGEILILVTKGKEQNMQSHSESTKNRIHRAIGARTNFTMYSSNPRMIPRGLKPECLKLLMIHDKPYKSNSRKQDSAEDSATHYEAYKQKFAEHAAALPNIYNKSLLTFGEKLQVWNSLDLMSHLRLQTSLQSQFEVEHSSLCRSFVSVISKLLKSSTSKVVNEQSISTKETINFGLNFEINDKKKMNNFNCDTISDQSVSYANERSSCMGTTNNEEEVNLEKIFPSPESIFCNDACYVDENYESPNSDFATMLQAVEAELNSTFGLNLNRAEEIFAKLAIADQCTTALIENESTIKEDDELNNDDKQEQQQQQQSHSVDSFEAAICQHFDYELAALSNDVAQDGELVTRDEQILPVDEDILAVQHSEHANGCGEEWKDGNLSPLLFESAINDVAFDATILDSCPSQTASVGILPNSVYAVVEPFDFSKVVFEEDDNEEEWNFSKVQLEFSSSPEEGDHFQKNCFEEMQLKLAAEIFQHSDDEDAGDPDCNRLEFNNNNDSSVMEHCSSKVLQSRKNIPNSPVLNLNFNFSLSDIESDNEEQFQIEKIPNTTKNKNNGFGNGADSSTQDVLLSNSSLSDVSLDWNLRDKNSKKKSKKMKKFDHDLIQFEAELSRDSNALTSGDESEESTDEEQLLNDDSFVVSSTYAGNMTQEASEITASQMRGHYVRSLNDSQVSSRGRGRYHPLYRLHWRGRLGMNVEDSFDKESDDDVEAALDSFVVPNDVIEYDSGGDDNLEELEKACRKRKHGKEVKPDAARRVIICNSSESESEHEQRGKDEKKRAAIKRGKGLNSSSEVAVVKKRKPMLISSDSDEELETAVNNGSAHYHVGDGASCSAGEVNPDTSTVVRKDIGLAHLDSSLTEKEEEDQASLLEVVVKPSSSTAEATTSAEPFRKPLILAASQEISSAQHLLATLRTQYNVSAHVCSLKDCDYIISNRMSVVRETYSDFTSSFSGIRERIGRLLSMFDIVVVLLEKDRLKKKGSSRMANTVQPSVDLSRSKAARKFLAKALVEPSLKVLYSDNIDTSAKLLSQLTRQEMNRGYGLQFELNLTESENDLLKFYLSIAGTNYASAMNLVKCSKSLQAVLSSSVKDLMRLGRMKRKQAQLFYNFINEQLDQDDIERL